MTSIAKGVLFALLLGTLFTAAAEAQTINAASCNLSDVQTAVNQVTVSGAIVNIPAGTCTWTGTLSIKGIGMTLTGTGTPNTGTATFGSGTLNTIIVDNAGSSNPLIAASGMPYGQTFTVALLDIEPNSTSASLFSPITIAGTCTASGCPNVRIDNIGFGLTTPWTEGGNGSPADWMIRTDNVFGVIDHCTLPTGSAVILLNANLSAYLGVGGYGDNSWAQPDSLGGANNLFIENSSVYTNQGVTDCDTAPVGGSTGGCRIVGRFNQVSLNAAFFTLGVHGLDTGGRMRSGREQELYANTITCVSGNGCNSGGVAFRGGTGFSWGDTYNVSNGGFYNHVDTATVYRTVYSDSPWGACGGSGSWDTNDGVVYYSGTMSTSGSGVLTMTDSSKSWTTNQFVPNGAPYSVYDTTQVFWAEITSNTSNTVSIASPISESGWAGFNNGDSYQILRATVCADQGGRGVGGYVSGSSPTPVGPFNQALDPMYEWMNTATNMNQSEFATDTGKIIANRDYYSDNFVGEQTSPTSPFNGTSGTGWGTTANRPTTCTPAVGYWAVDQGSWNTSGNGFGQGELFVCTATNTWTLYYTPYSYPHPLTQATTVSPPTNLTAVAH
jgi:hypothetical protein